MAGGGSLSGDELGEQDAAVFNLVRLSSPKNVCSGLRFNSSLMSRTSAYFLQDRRAPKRTSTKTKTKKKTSTKTTKAVKRTSTKTKTTKTKSKTPGPKTTKAIASATTHTVLVGTPGSSFSPSTLTINKGDSVLWSWVDGFHSVSQTTGATCDFSGFDSGVDGAPKTFVRNFTQTATVHYACQPHCFSGMQGKIIVT